MQRRWGTKRDAASELGFACVARQLHPAKLDSAALIITGDLLHAAMQKDELLVARLAQERDHPLCLAQRIGADEMRTFGKQRDRMEELGDLGVGVAVPKHRQGESRLRDEDVAGLALEPRAGRIRNGLVIA